MRTSFMNRIRPTGCRAGAGLMLLAVAGCVTTKTETAPQENIAELRDAIVRAGYIPLEFPTSGFHPGAIVEMVQLPDGKIRLERYSEMKTCGATEDEISTNAGTAFGFSANRTFKAGVDLSLKLGETSVTPSAEFLNGTQVKIGQTAAPSLDRIKMSGWRERIADGYDGLSLPSECRQIATDTPPNLFIVREALAMMDGTIIYDVKAGVEAKLSGELQQLAAANAGIGYEGGSSVSFDGPIYVGVKRLAYVADLSPSVSPVTRATAPAGPTVLSDGPAAEAIKARPAELEGEELKALLGGTISN
ncbi:MAG: hypothetical protein AAFV62_01870 [Pseudomonadota bacterium]